MTGKERGGSTLDPRVTRRDFINTALVGAGTALLQAPGPAAARDSGVGWNGYGGVGDSRSSNGETWGVTESAHRIRDHAYDGELGAVVDSGEQYDLVVVGGGFSGMGALLEFKKSHPRGTCLLLDNQEIFGGYAKANEFDVDGYRIAGAQASMNFILPRTAEDRANSYWTELGLPEQFRWADRQGGDPLIVFPKATSAALYHGEQTATIGYYFQNALTRGEGRWIKDIWNGDLQGAPWPQPFKGGLLALRDRKLRGKPDDSQTKWLDSMTFADFATREVGVSPEVLSYITLGMCITGPQVSAYGAQSFPGLARYAPGSAGAELGERFVSFPAGNTTLLRHFVKAIFPDAIPGPSSLQAVASGPVDFTALDRPGALYRMRLRATVVRVKHEGDHEAADHVSVLYEKGGRLHRVNAKAVAMGSGSWVNKHIVADLPADRRVALDQFLYAPMLIVNVALRNWRFLDKLGISTARWFDGFGFFCSVRQPMVLDRRAPPFHPDKPIVMTFYVPIQNPELPLEAQGPTGRVQLYGTSYAQYEKQVVEQMQRMFGSAGFAARRDIAGIVLNRWGHAFVTPPPGFFFGKNGRPAPRKVALEPFGRIAFGQTGLEDWLGAAHGGKRAVTELAQAL